jgi:hypothetical protein
MLVRTLFGIYLILRISEAGELGLIAYAEAHSIHLAASLVFCFLFGLAVVIVGVARLGDRIAITWHIILEILLIPLSIELAWNATFTVPSASSLLGSLSPEHRFVLMIVLNGVIQSLLAVAGLHVVKWTAMTAARKQLEVTALSKTTLTPSNRPDSNPRIHHSLLRQSRGQLQAISNIRARHHT